MIILAVFDPSVGMHSEVAILDADSDTFSVDMLHGLDFFIFR